MSFREGQCIWKTQNAEHIGANQCALDADHTGEHVWPSSSHSDCRSEDGITVGLIDAIITMSRLLIGRNWDSYAVIEAFKDLHSDSAVGEVMKVE